jgi:hypothetical protein
MSGTTSECTGELSPSRKTANEACGCRLHGEANVTTGFVAYGVKDDVEGCAPIESEWSMDTSYSGGGEVNWIRRGERPCSLKLTMGKGEGHGAGSGRTST